LAHHNAVVYNNCAYLLGGIRSNGVSNTELYKFDILGSKWDLARQRDDMPGFRDDHTCNLYEDTIVLFGGYETGVRTNDLLSYKFETFKWTKLSWSGSAPCPRAGHSAVVHGNTLVVYAGTDHENHRLNDTWVYEF